VHLPDIIELAKEIKSRMSAREVLVQVTDTGILSAHIWYSPIRGFTLMDSIHGYKLEKPPARTPEDLLALVDRVIEQDHSRDAVAADFGITEDGRPLINAAE
jgi:hypothetical protein